MSVNNIGISELACDSMPKQNKDVQKSVLRPGPDKGRGTLNKGITWFLGIGINTYKEFSPLNNAVKDIEDIKNVLLDGYDFTQDKAILLLNEEATKENIVEQLDHLAEAVKQEDKLLIYYSGHGHLNQHTGLGYWIPYDAKKDKTSNYILNSTIRDYIKVIEARHILLISDSCFSGSLFVRGAKRSVDIAMEDLEAIPSRWAICSGRHDELVYDGEPGKNSPFADSILELLRKNEKRFLNVAKVADRVVEQTRANYEQLPEGNPLYGVGHKGGQFIFHLKANEESDWSQAEKEGTLESYRVFLSKHPQSKYATTAKQKIDFEEEVVAWNKSKLENTLLAYLRYDQLYPNGRYARLSLEATTHLEEEQTWKLAQERHLLSAYRKYVLDYPEGRYRQEAEASIRKISTAEQETQIWNQTLQKDTIDAYEAYLKQYPDGVFASKVQEKLQGLTLLKNKQELAEKQKEEARRVEQENAQKKLQQDEEVRKNAEISSFEHGYPPFSQSAFNAKDHRSKQNDKQKKADHQVPEVPLVDFRTQQNEKQLNGVAFLKKHARWVGLLVLIPLLIWAAVSLFSRGTQTQAPAKSGINTLPDKKNPISGAYQIANGTLGKRMSWGALDSLIIGKFGPNTHIRIVSRTITSPTTKKVLSEFMAKFPSTTLIQYDSISYSAILQANEQCFGLRCLPNYNFKKASMIVSFDADFLGSWMDGPHYIRKSDNDNYHAQLESNETITGSKANERIVMTVSEQVAAMIVFYNEIVRLTKVKGKFALLAEPDLAPEKKLAMLRLANQIIKKRGRSLVLSGSNQIRDQLLTNKINYLLDNYFYVISFNNVPLTHAGDERDMDKLITEMEAGTVDALIVMDGSNPSVDLPNANAFKSAMGKVGLKISFSGFLDETTLICNYVAPTPKLQERWSDSEPREDFFRLFKPTISASLGTRPSGESLLRWAESQNLNTNAKEPYLDYLKSYWCSEIFPLQSEYMTPNAFWESVIARSDLSIFPLEEKEKNVFQCRD